MKPNPNHRSFLRRAALAATGLAGLTYAARRFMQRPLPQLGGSHTVKGLIKPVEVVRDHWGVPHIYAQNETDLFFAQGFVQAQDRFFQMDLNRRVGAGRISEVAGPRGLAGDRFARIAGWPRAALAHLSSADPETKETLDAFAAGVNAFIALGKLPVEFSLLFYKPEPWRPLDSSLWGVVLAWGLSVNWETELMRAAFIEQLGPEKAADLSPPYNDTYKTVLPATDMNGRLAMALLEAYKDAVNYLPLGNIPTGGVGSNNWAVNGQHTLSGRPILANDPHLPPMFPTFWYENHLSGGRYQVTGFSMPGVPGILIGHNEEVAWGFTNASPDVQDLYLERFHPEDSTLYEVDGQWTQAEIATEVIRVRGRSPVIEKVTYTRHGPIISDLIPGEKRALALRWTVHDPGNHLRAVLGMNRAKDWPHFRESLRYWAFPSQNVVYADIQGNIGYMMPGVIPLRARGSGLVPVPGWQSDDEWVGWIPFEELPSLYNPIEGAIVTANNQIVGEDYPYHLTGEWLPPYRAGRIQELIQQLAPLTMEKNERIQNDTVSLMARRFLPLALELLAQGGKFGQGNSVEERAFRLLRQWDYDMRPDLAAPSLFFGLQSTFARLILTQVAGSTVARLLATDSSKEFLSHPFYDVSLELAVCWLESGAPDWVGDIRPLLFRAYRQTIATLHKAIGPDPAEWHWGKLHHVHFHHHLAGIPGLGRLWKPIVVPTGGDGYTVNQSETAPTFPPDPAHIIASCRMILDVGDWDNSRSALPGGQSGHPASPHYQDGLAEWRHGRYHPMLFSRRAVEAAAKSKLLLLPL